MGKKQATQPAENSARKTAPRAASAPVKTTRARASGGGAATGAASVVTPSANEMATANDEHPAATDGAAMQTPADRAEELFDEIGRRVGQYALIAGLNLRLFAARAREEAEDIWAEAQHLRGGGPQ